MSSSVVIKFVLLDFKLDVYLLYIVVCPFVLFLLSIVLSVLLRYTDSDYPFGIYKLFYIEKLNIHMAVWLECWYKQMGNLQLES